jgi:hypothetical protein
MAFGLVGVAENWWNSAVFRGFRSKSGAGPIPSATLSHAWRECVPKSCRRPCAIRSRQGQNRTIKLRFSSLECARAETRRLLYDGSIGI